MASKNLIDLAMDRVVKLNMQAIDLYEQEVIKPIMDEIKNPEKLIGKKYEEWTPFDRQMVTQIYQQIPQVLENFIAKKEYEQLVELTQEV